MIWFGNDNLWVAIFEFLGTRCARSSGDTFGKGPIMPGWCFQALFPITIQMVWSCMIHIDRFEHPPVNDIVHGKIHHWSVSCGFPMFFFLVMFEICYTTPRRTYGKRWSRWIWSCKRWWKRIVSAVPWVHPQMAELFQVEVGEDTEYHITIIGEYSTRV